MNQRLIDTVGVHSLTLVLLGFSPASSPPPAEVNVKPALPPEPVVNHSPSDAQPGQRIERGEWILDVDEATRQLMEGQRHGYENLTIGITYTGPGGAPPMHTHKGEESHVLLKGHKVLYALGDKLFVKEEPYIVNIPPRRASLVPKLG